MYEYAQELIAQEEAGQGTALLNPKSSSTTFYKKGAWVLHMLRDKVGDEAFKKAIKNYLKTNAFKNVETDDFINEVENVSGQDLTKFVDTWLKNESLPEDFATFNAVTNSEKLSETSMFTYLGTIENEVIPIAMLRFELEQSDNADFSKAKRQFFLFNNALSDETEPVSEKIIIEYLHNLHRFSIDDQLILLQEAFKSDNIKIRQAIALALTEIWVPLKSDYETLLDDKSYITKEAALYNLWINFPEDRNRYLDITKDIIGLSDKNVRLLWLTLSLVTPEYAANEKKAYLSELIKYTSPAYNYEIRMQAFSFLDSLEIINEEIIDHYEQAGKHHNWRLKKFAKTFLVKNKENLKITN